MLFVKLLLGIFLLNFLNNYFASFSFYCCSFLLVKAISFPILLLSRLRVKKKLSLIAIVGRVKNILRAIPKRSND